MKSAFSIVLFALLVAATPGQPAPALESPAMQGAPVSLSRLRGRVVVVDFWASWCEPCRRSFPALDALARRHAASGLTVVGVSVDDELSNAQRAARELRPSFAIVHDGAHRIAERWAPPSVPSTFVIGRDGRVVGVVSGENPAQIEAYVAAALRR
jgi:peroxiredoxin